MTPGVVTGEKPENASLARMKQMIFLGNIATA
jgi:hypothetical protein